MADFSATVTESQRQTILNALTERLIEAEGYLRGSRLPATPAPEHTCCEFHRARFERDRNVYLAMEAKKRDIEALIQTFSA